MPGRVTIAELARRSGVSTGTVSRALNGYRDVSPDTRARVVALARELGYEPDASARTLRTRRSMLAGAYLGRCGDDPSQPFFRAVLAGLGERLAARGYGLMVVEGTGDLRPVRRGALDGAVVMSVDAGDPVVAALAAAGVPTVGVDVELAAHVAADHRGGTALAVRHLAQLGHRRIAHVAGTPHTLAGRERLAGYRAGLEAAGLPYDPALVAAGDFSLASGEAAAAARAGRPPDRRRRRLGRDGDRGHARGRRARPARARLRLGRRLRRPAAGRAGRARADDRAPGCRADRRRHGGRAPRPDARRRGRRRTVVPSA